MERRAADPMRPVENNLIRAEEGEGAELNHWGQAGREPHGKYLCVHMCVREDIMC